MKCYPLILTLLAVAAVGCQSKPTPPREVGLVPPGSFVKGWEADTTIKKVNALHFEGEMLFLYGPGNIVVGYDLNGGLKFRTAVAPKDTIAAPIVTADQVIFPSSSTLQIFTRNGTQVRSVGVRAPIRSPGVINNGIVYVGIDAGNGGRLAAIALDKAGDVNPVVWTRMTKNGAIISTRPTIFENVVYSATQDGQVFAVTPDPILLWPRGEEMKENIFETDGRILGAIKADEGGVFVPSTDSKLYCVNTATGKIRWTYYAGTPLNSTPVLSSELVYLFVNGKGLVAIDKKPGGGATREPRWVAGDATKVLADDAKYSYVLTRGGKVNALDKKTGAVAFSSDRNDYVDGVQNMNPKDNTIYVMTKGGKLMSIKPVSKTGVIGELATTDATSAPLAAAN